MCETCRRIDHAHLDPLKMIGHTFILSSKTDAWTVVFTDEIGDDWELVQDPISESYWFVLPKDAD